MSTPPTSISLVLPIQRAGVAVKADLTTLEHSVGAYASALGSPNSPEWTWEIVLVPSGADAIAASRRLESAHDRVRMCVPVAGWGAAVREGLQASQGELLCYTNYERTSAAVLERMLTFANRSQPVVLRANRRTRDTTMRRSGSLLFNLECRALLGVATWDVNGTPKVFPRSFGSLLELTSEDDLLDAEFCAVCERHRYPVVEMPIDAPLPVGAHSRLDYRSALRMYLGVPALKRRLSADATASSGGRGESVPG